MGFESWLKPTNKQTKTKQNVPRTSTWTTAPTDWSYRCRTRPWTSACVTQFQSLRNTARPCNCPMRHHPPPRSPAATPRLLVPTAVVPLSGSSAPSRILIPASSHLSSSMQLCVVLVLLHFRRIRPLLLLLPKTLPSTTTTKTELRKLPISLTSTKKDSC